jgi:translation initiation factor IF-2
MPPVNRRVVVSGPVSVKNLADELGVKAGDLIRRLMDLGVMATLNHELDRDTAVIVAGEFGARVEERATDEEREGVILAGENDQAEDLVPRPPVITVMGHVDHGKTSLLDRIRSTRVTAHEAGGITQHIGASVVEWNGHRLVFLDTPGHEAFTAMRARGAQVTDLAVLVVAANDGVMPQTVEAINHARAAAVPVVVAINKIDLENANPERVKQSLTEHELVPEEWGGDTIMVPVSALTGEGMDRLLESLVAQAEILELTANPHRAAQGTIIEAQLDRGRGPVATVLVQRGTLRVGDAFVSGHVWGKVRALLNDRGERVPEAGPSTPVEVLGFDEVPGAGDDFIALADDKQAREIGESRRQRRRARETDTVAHGVSLDEFYQRLQDKAVRDLNLVVKADVQGSAEALADSLSKIAHEEARVRILHTGVGAVTESDVMLASASHAIIVGFGVGTDGKARRLAEQEHVDIRMYRVIYDAIDDVRQALTGLLAPKYQEVVLGRAEVREVFRVPRLGAVAGCYVTEGKVTRGAQVRVIRDGKIVHEGAIASLRRFKDDVREVANGYECGVGLERFNDVKVGDQFEVFAQEEVPASQAG